MRRVDTPGTRRTSAPDGLAWSPYADPEPAVVDLPSEGDRDHPRRDEERRRPRPVVVELVRVVIVALLAAAGSKAGGMLGAGDANGRLVGIVLGSAIGYVVGGVFGRRTATAVSDMERQFARASAAEVLAGGFGLLLGLVTAALVSLPLFHLPGTAAYVAVGFVYPLCGYVGYRIGRAKSDDLFALFGVKPRAAGHRSGEISVLDSSALLDGRIAALLRMGFVSGTLLVTRAVLEELQSVADSSDAGRRARGRRALDLLTALRRDPAVDIMLVHEPVVPANESTDSQLVRIAKDRGAVLVTNDHGLAKVAEALDVAVRSIHALAEALRPPVLAGDQVSIRLMRPGRDAGQAVGYLDDGTMVVVEAADGLIGERATVAVTNAIQTPTGQMVFARLPDGGGSSPN